KSSLKKRADGSQQTTDFRHVQIDTPKVGQAQTSSIMNSRSESLKSILKASLGLEAQGFRTGSSLSYKTEKRSIIQFMYTSYRSDRLSSVTLEILMEREEIDIHPYGRGGIYEGILYKRKEDETPNVLELFVWFIIFGSLVMISVIIVFIAELSYLLHVGKTMSDRKAHCEFFKNCREV
ncbi:hypothetical protein EG68_10904, partial [Paragonimus skrjabini miyazakii]